MPSPELILAAATATANDWRTLAVGWHAYVAVLIAMIAGARLTLRQVAFFSIAPLASVSALAWITGNPFNGSIFAAVSILLAAIARRVPGIRARMTPGLVTVAGALVIAFAWTYPHFLRTDSWVAYLYAAPLGLIPCPTLSAVVGLTLVAGLHRVPAWSATLVVMTVVYGAIGIFQLGVTLDYFLLAAAAVLAAATFAARSRPAPLTNAFASTSSARPGESARVQIARS